MMKWIFVITLVIVNPYEGIDYEQINVYEIDEQCLDDCIHYTQSEFMNMSDEIEAEIEALTQEPQPSY